MELLNQLNKDFIIIFTKTDKIKDSLIDDLCDDYINSIKNIYDKNIYFKSSSLNKKGRQEILSYIKEISS